VRGVTPPPALEAFGVEQVFHTRQGPFRALSEIDLQVREGETVALVGQSGSGKSTLARILLGLQSPTSGRVRCFGADVAGMERRARARLMQPVQQDPYASLNPRQTLARVIAAPKIAQGQRLAQCRDEVLAMMEEVGLPPAWADRRPLALSGGQRQRVAIARALIARPRILICDEPTSALDVSVQAQILNLLVDLRERHALTMLIVTHNMSVVAHLADTVVVMTEGRVVEQGPAEAVLTRPAEPYTRELLGSVLSLDPDDGLPSARAPLP
jgi:peptide/nickel transport system ATP-binding protein